MMMLLTRRFRTVVISMEVFAFANTASDKVLVTLRVHAFDTVSPVATVINLHPDFAVGAIEIELTFLFTTVAFATAIHFLIVVVAFCMNSVMTIALRFSKLTSYQRLYRRRWRRKGAGAFFLLGFNVNRQVPTPPATLQLGRRTDTLK